MASKQFLSSAISYVPQAGFTATYTESGGIEASQDFVVRNSDLRNGSPVAVFQRGVTWETVWPDVPEIYRKLTMRDFNPTDNGDGTSILKVNFTGYQFSASGSSGDEVTVPTTTLTGQLEDRPLSDHPKWVALAESERIALGKLLSGEWGWGPNPFETDGAFYTYIIQDEQTTACVPDPITTADAITFAKIITEGDTTYRKGGWTYSYNTESETGFPAAQLNELGKIVATPPGSPVDPGAGWTWLLTSPNQTQSGPKRFVKVLDFQLIRDNAKNQFLYGS